MEGSVNSLEYKTAIKSYRNGFLIGAFTGIVICLVTAKTYLVLPVMLGLLFGAIAFDRKIKEDGKK